LGVGEEVEVFEAVAVGAMSAQDTTIMPVEGTTTMPAAVIAWAPRELPEEHAMEPPIMVVLAITGEPSRDAPSWCGGR
jgi:hypothetical protein